MTPTHPVPALRPQVSERLVESWVARGFPKPLHKTPYKDEAAAAVLQSCEAGSRAPVRELVQWAVNDQVLRFRNDVTQVISELLATAPVPGLSVRRASYRVVLFILLTEVEYDPQLHPSLRAWVRGVAMVVLARFRARKRKEKRRRILLASE